MGTLGWVSIVHVTLGTPRMGHLAPQSCILQPNTRGSSNLLATQMKN